METPAADERNLSSENNPKVSVVVLSHDRLALLPAVLDSIVAQTYANVEIIVVDNKSVNSERIAKLVRSYSDIRLLQNAENLWYTGGMNRGIAAARGEYVHCTVDDVLLDKDCIRQLVKYAVGHPAAGLMCGILYFEDRRSICFAGGEFELAGTYLKKVYGEGEQDVGQFPEPFKVSCVDGAMLFSRMECIRRINGFREDFLIYVDSIELSARILKQGYEIVVVPQAKAYIVNAPHAFSEKGITFHKLKNLYAFYVLHAPVRVLPEFFCRYGVLALVHSAFRRDGEPYALLRAWLWLAWRMPSLIRERHAANSYSA